MSYEGYWILWLKAKGGTQDLSAHEKHGGRGVYDN